MVINLLEELVEIIKTSPLLMGMFVVEVLALILAPFVPVTREIIADFGYMQYFLLAIIIQIPLIIIFAITTVFLKITERILRG